MHITTIDNMTRVVRRATKEMKKLQKLLYQLERRNTKVPRKIKKQLKKEYSEKEYLLRKRLGCFSKQFIRYYRSADNYFPPIFFGGGLRNYILQKQINKDVLNHYRKNSVIISPPKISEEQYNFQDVPDKIKDYFTAVTDHFPAETKIKRIEDFLCPEILNKSFPVIDWGMPPCPDYFEKAYSKIQGLSMDHLIIDDYEQTEQNNSSSTFGSGNQREDIEASDH